MNEYENNGCNNNLTDLDIFQEEDDLRKQVFFGCNHVWSVAWKSVGFGYDIWMIMSCYIILECYLIMLCYIGVFCLCFLEKLVTFEMTTCIVL